MPTQDQIRLNKSKPKRDPHGRCGNCIPTTFASFRDEALVSVHWIHYCGRMPEQVTGRY